MSFQDKLREIDRLQQAIEAQGKMQDDVLRRIQYKFRLEWNYYSNRMEGNTLTMDETKSVMVGSLNVKDKPLKDVMEMRGHDDAILQIIRMGKGELNLSESRIRELHKAIMYEEDEEKKRQIGQWKQVANHVINPRGEKFDFTAPEAVPGAMHDLINWLNTEKEKIEREAKGRMHPVILAFQFHLRYLTIHPFYDGNGRTGRILTNLILISSGYPPIYVRDKDKDAYYRYLAEVQGYGVEEALLYEVLADYLIRSMTIAMDAIEGRNIEEPDDIDKEIEIFKKTLDRTKERQERSDKQIESIITLCAIPLFTRLKAKLLSLEELFERSSSRILYGYSDESTGQMLSTAKFSDSLLKIWLPEQTKLRELKRIGLEYNFRGYKPGSPFDITVHVQFHFKAYSYEVKKSLPFTQVYQELDYGQFLNDQDITSVVNTVVREVFEQIKHSVKNGRNS